MSHDEKFWVSQVISIISVITVIRICQLTNIFIDFPVDFYIDNLPPAHRSGIRKGCKIILALGSKIARVGLAPSIHIHEITPVAKRHNEG